MPVSDAATPPSLPANHTQRVIVFWTLPFLAALALWPALRHLLATDFLPHWYCYLGNRPLAYLHITADVVIGLSYVAISFTLGYLVYRGRREIPFRWIFVAFGLFIVACGFTHFMEVLTVFKPYYWLSGEVKVITALASAFTAVALPPLVPRTLSLVRAEKLAEQRRTALEATYEDLQESNRKLGYLLGTSEARFRRLVDSNIMGILTVELDGNITEINDAAVEMLGYTREEILSSVRWPQLIPPDRVESSRMEFVHLIRDGSLAPREGELVRKDGERVPVLAAALLDEPGSERAIALALDLREHKRVERERAELLEREQRARRAAEEAVESVRRLQTITEAALAHLELPDLLKVLVSRLQGLLDGDTIAILLRDEHEDEFVVRAAVGLEQEVVQKVRIPWGRGVAGRIASSPRPVAIEDLTAVEGFSDVLRNSGVVSLLGAPLIAEGRVIGVVHVGSRQPRQFAPEESDLLQYAADRIATAIQHAHLYHQQVVAARELEQKGREVEQLNLELEERVRLRTAELQAAVAELEAFSYSVSHDLRAPLRSIDGFSQMLLEDYGPELNLQARDDLRRVRNASSRMGRLIDDLLQLSRAELTRDPVDLTALAQLVVKELQDNDNDRDIEVKLQPSLTASGDPRLLEAALANLLGNAWKFTAGKPQACIEFGETSVLGERAFFVRDNGAGFNMEYAGKLFQPFQRLHAPGEFEGTGVGLAIVQRIIARHGGRVWAQSDPGQGATFYFTLG